MRAPGTRFSFLPDSGVHAEPAQASMQLAWMQGSLRRGNVLPGAQTENAAAAR